MAFSTKIKGTHHLQVAMFRCIMHPDPCCRKTTFLLVSWAFLQFRVSWWVHVRVRHGMFTIGSAHIMLRGCTWREGLCFKSAPRRRLALDRARARRQRGEARGSRGGKKGPGGRWERDGQLWVKYRVTPKWKKYNYWKNTTISSSGRFP